MSSKFFKKCQKELNQLLKESEGDFDKTTDLMAAVSGIVVVLMTDTKTKNITLPAENDMSLILQMLPDHVVEVINKTFEEYMSANKPTVQ